MRFCIYGAGAIGGYVAVELASAGHDVCVIARGAHLRAIRERGLTLKIEGREKVARVRASNDPSEFGHQDFVICALKAHQAYASAPDFAPLLGPATAVLTAMGAVVLFLAALGLYGILSYTAGRQTREIGIRLALGAQPRHVLMPVLARTIIVVLAASALGTVLSIPVTRLLAKLLSGEADITAQLFSVAALAVACLTASLAPIRRALGVDPATALRQE